MRIEEPNALHLPLSVVFPASIPDSQTSHPVCRMHPRAHLGHASLGALTHRYPRVLIGEYAQVVSNAGQRIFLARTCTYTVFNDGNTIFKIIIVINPRESRAYGV